MYKICTKTVTSDDVELTKAIKYGPVELGRENKREMSGPLTGYCHETIENEGKLIEFRLLIPEFDTCGKMKDYIIPQWRIENTFNLKAADVKGKYITLTGTGSNLEIIKIQEAV